MGELKPQHAPPERRMLMHTAVLLCLVTVAITFSAPTWRGAFLSGDDQRFVTDHYLVNHPSLAHAAELLVILHGDLYQPIPMLSFQLDHALAARQPDSRFGVAPEGFHIANILLHAANALLVYAFIFRLTNRAAIAGLTGLLFACHPFAVEPVAWISGRMILLATLFALLTLIFCLPPPGRDRVGWSAVLPWILSLLSKVLPTVPIAAAWCGHVGRRSLAKNTLLLCTVLFVAALAASGFAWMATESAGFTPTAEDVLSPGWTRLVLATSYYLENYLVPVGLSPWVPPPHNVRTGQLAIAIVEIIGLVACLLLARRRCRWAYAGLVLFLILLLPFLAASLARRQLAADRYMYLPIIGMHLAVSACIVAAADAMRARKRPGSHALIAVFGVVVATLGISAGWKQAQAWSSTINRDQATVRQYPNSVDAWSELAKAFIFEKDPEEALAVVSEARKRWPNNARLAAQAGEAHFLMADWISAERELEEASRKMPGHLRTKYTHALCLEELNRPEMARRVLQEILDLHAGFLPALTALARNYSKAGDKQRQYQSLEQVLSINPRHRDSLLDLALLDMERGAYQEAEKRLQQILGVNPSDVPARVNLAVTWSGMGRDEEALALYDELLAGRTGNLALTLNRAHTLQKLGRSKKAEAEFRRILERSPGNIEAAAALHEILGASERNKDLPAFWVAFRETSAHRTEATIFLACAYALNDMGTEAVREAHSIDVAAPERAFADWVLAYHAIRLGKEEEMVEHLGQPARPPLSQRTIDRQHLAVLNLFVNLPQAQRNSPAGTYALARLCFFRGDFGTAGAIASRLAKSEEQPWRMRANALLATLKAMKAPSKGPD